MPNYRDSFQPYSNSTRNTRNITTYPRSDIITGIEEVIRVTLSHAAVLVYGGGCSLQEEL